MTYKTTGFIIGKRVSREHDRVFIVYTQDHGKLEVLAQGVLKLSSKLGGNLELLTKASFLFARGKMYDRIASVDTLHTFKNTKQNLVKLVVALASAEMLHQLVAWEAKDVHTFQLYEEFLEELEGLPDHTQTKYVINLLNLFTVKLSILLGYRAPLRLAKQFLDRLSTSSLPSFRDEQMPPFVKTLARNFLSENLTKQLKGKAYLDLITKTTIHA